MNKADEKRVSELENDLEEIKEDLERVLIVLNPKDNPSDGLISRLEKAEEVQNKHIEEKRWLFRAIGTAIIVSSVAYFLTQSQDEDHHNNHGTHNVGNGATKE